MNKTIGIYEIRSAMVLVALFFAATCYVGAQGVIVQRELSIELLPDENAVYADACGRNTLGIIVIRTAISNLNITVSPDTRPTIVQNRQRNEYILCVEPSRQYVINITHTDYVDFNFIAENVLANRAQIFRLNPKELDLAAIRAELERRRQNLSSAGSETAPSSASAPGGTQRHAREPEMILVQGGTFTMGCTAEQSNDCRDNEGPVHRVALSSYRIGKYPVTQAQWVAVMGTNPSHYKGDNLPVDNVSWNEAQEYIRRLNSITGGNYRLPTEAEWEFAARGGTRSQNFKYSGSNNINDVAWHSANSNNSTQPVGSKSPNELGIYDMSGNVWEWCNDVFANYTSTAKNNPTGGSSGIRRVLRGGGWFNEPNACRVTYRNENMPDNKFSTFGLRLASSN